MRRTVAASVLVVLAAAGCGGGTSVNQTHKVRVDSLAVVHAAAQKATALRTFHFAMRMTMTPHGHQFTMSMNGDMNLAARVGSFSGTIGGPDFPAGTTTMSMVLTPSAFYMQMPLLSAQLGGKPWLKVDFAALSQKSGINFRQLLQQSTQSDPSVYLQMLAASGDIKVIGHETIDGISTTHYAGTVPLDHLNTNLSSSLRQRLIQAARRLGMTDVAIDAWISTDGLARRLMETSQTNFGPFSVAMDLTHYGEHISITPPPASEVTDLGALLAGHSGM